MTTTTTETAPPPAPDTDAAVEIARIATETMLVPIVGTSALIVHNFGAKARQMILESQQGKARQRQIRDPEAEYQTGFYRLPGDRYGFPATAFKSATVGAARFYDRKVKMTDLRQFLWFRGEISDLDPQALIEIEGTPRMREDTVRLSGPARTVDLRFRPEFPDWKAVLPVTYVRSSLSRDSVLNLINAGGMGIGVGEWRPEKRGDFGTYQVDLSRELVIVRDDEIN